MTKSGTGMWVMGAMTRGFGDVGTLGHRDMGLGNTGTWDSGMWDARMLGLEDTGTLGDSRMWDIGTKGHDKQHLNLR